MDDGTRGLEGLLPRGQWSRRGFVMTSLATGFALSVEPVSAETIHTDAQGIAAGEVKIPVADGSFPAYHARPEQGGPAATVLVVRDPNPLSNRAASRSLNGWQRIIQPLPNFDHDPAARNQGFLIPRIARKESLRRSISRLSCR